MKLHKLLKTYKNGMRSGEWYDKWWVCANACHDASRQVSPEAFFEWDIYECIERVVFGLPSYWHVKPQL